MRNRTTFGESMERDMAIGNAAYKKARTVKNFQIDTLLFNVKKYFAQDPYNFTVEVTSLQGKPLFRFVYFGGRINDDYYGKYPEGLSNVQLLVTTKEDVAPLSDAYVKLGRLIVSKQGQVGKDSFIGLALSQPNAENAARAFAGLFITQYLAHAYFLGLKSYGWAEHRPTGFDAKKVKLIYTNYGASIFNNHGDDYIAESTMGMMSTVQSYKDVVYVPPAPYGKPMSEMREEITGAYPNYSGGFILSYDTNFDLTRLTMESILSLNNIG